MNTNKIIAIILVCVLMMMVIIGCKPRPKDNSSYTSFISNEASTEYGETLFQESSTTDQSLFSSSQSPGVTGGTTPATSTATQTTSDNIFENILDYQLSSNPKYTKSSVMYYVYVKDMMRENISDREKYDQFSFITSYQGLTNATKPCIFIEWEQEIDRFWYDYITSKGKIYEGMSVTNIGTFEQFIEIFINDIKVKGIVAWDKDVPATSNVAATICGVDGYLPVRYETNTNSVYQILTQKYNVPVKLNLVGKFTGNGTIPDINRKSSGSSKCDAYLWAIEKYLNKTDVGYMAYFLDAATWGDDPDNPYYSNLDNCYLPNRDYAIARKAFFFDLSVWGDEAPCDDPTQPLGTDLETMKELMQKQYNRHNGKKIVQITGYTPWQIKYTTWQSKGKHEGVETEWRSTEIFTAYNCVLDADSAAISDLANASMYMHYPLKSSYTNSEPLISNPINNPEKKYIYLYVGDYDSAAWVARFVPEFFTDPNRGKIPIAWTFNPNLSQRVPMAFDYVYENKTSKDFFVAGDSGAGYANPTRFLEGQRVYSSNPSGMDTWISWNKYFYKLFDLSITGFLLNGNIPTNSDVYDAYLQFSKDGIMVGNTVSVSNPILYKGMPIVMKGLDIAKGEMSVQYPAGSLTENAKNTADVILSGIRSTKTNTYAFRTVICPPTFLYEVYKSVRSRNPNVEFLDPYTFFEMVKQQ